MSKNNTRQRLVKNSEHKDSSVELIVYVHSDNGEYHALYRDGELICWDKKVTKIPTILQGLGIPYFDYQISDNVCEPDFGKVSWTPPESLSYLHFINKAERRSEYRKQKEINSSVKPEDFEHIKFIKQAPTEKHRKDI